MLQNPEQIQGHILLKILHIELNRTARPYPEAVQEDEPTLVTHADLHPAYGRLLE